jgi:HK97 gp10 family phage protein
MLKSRIPKIVGEMAVAVDAVVVAGAQRVADNAAMRVRRREGELARQTHVDDRKREGVYVLAGDPKDPSFAFYGHMIEFGTSHSPPYPFLVPALEDEHELIVDDVRAVLGRL